MTLDTKSIDMMPDMQSAVYTTLPLLPLKNTVILPKSIIPIIVGRPVSIKAVERALKGDREIFITAQRDAELDTPNIHDVYTRGTRSLILQVGRLPKGALKILVEGLERNEIVHAQAEDGLFMATCATAATIGLEHSVELDALWRHMAALYHAYTQLQPKAPVELLANVKTPEDMEAIGDTLAVHLNLSFAERQELLELSDFPIRLTRLAALLRKEIEILEAEERIRGRVQTQVEKNQREYYLTEQMKAIQKELGRDDQMHEVQQLRSKLKGLNLPADAAERVEKELKRLEQMPSLSSEAVVSRHYVDWIMSIPWHKSSQDTISITAAQKILDERHAGLKKVKERIIEFLAAKKFSPQLSRSPIICLVGPPGVGKTSLAASIAESLGREFVRISLGGVRDEAEIRGHRRTYIGALPGKIIQVLRKVKTVNPVILLDEIDKMSSDTHGDPGAALLEVLDPEQNRAFVDHFLEVEYDLSKVMFIMTANHAEGIPYPLFDRMEMITLSGYTDAEKLAIAEKFLLPKLFKEHNIKPRQCAISRDIISLLINEYTKEAGVRQLERVLAKLIRKAIQELLEQPERKKVAVTAARIATWLGAPKYKKTAIDLVNPRVGLATGLAWTELGGDILEIEIVVLTGKGGVTLTGQLGEVMQESAQAALSYIRSRADSLGLGKNFNASRDIHIHVPEGATPKDGPSAGITMCVALISALTKRPVLPRVAMTGEITLQGRVLGVGGLKEKVLAAEQHGMTKVLLPKENEADVAEFKHELKSETQIVFVATMDEVLEHTFAKKPMGATKRMQKTKKNNKDAHA